MLTNIKAIGNLSKLAREKSSPYLAKKIAAVELEEASAHGWEKVKTFANGSHQINRPKPYGLAIADRVWHVLYKMKFLHMSAEGPAQLQPERRTPYRRNLDIDIVGIDKEVGVAVFLKTSPEIREADESFSQELALYAEAQSEFTHIVNNEFRSDDQRTKLKGAIVIFACNITVSEADRSFAKAKKIALFDEDDLVYYETLVDHLGTAARYQFLADVFDETEVPGLTIEVPAIHLKIGKFSYYSFAIQPEYLLKISYIAHRIRGEKANEEAYQRMVEKKRLTEMREYINRPAIFPTNIVISLKKKPRFDEIALQVTQRQWGTFGKLTLKNTYKSAWIIDGQHRLYSYVDYEKDTSPLLSVIAFEELSPEMQAEFFIDINSKQHRVDQKLMSELYAQIHKDASDPAERMQALISQAISRLDEENNSPFYQRILKTEDKKNTKRCITWTSIFSDISDAFLTHPEKGILCVQGDDDATRERIVSIVKAWFTSIKKEVLNWWDAGSAKGSGGLAMNDSVSACFIVLRNVLQYLQARQNNLLTLDNQALIDLINPYASIVSTYLATFPREERQSFRDYSRGKQGQTKSARSMLLAIQKGGPDFVPPALKEAEYGYANDRARALLGEIRGMLWEMTVLALQNEFGEAEVQWWNEGIPTITRHNVEQKWVGDNASLQDREKYLDFEDYMAIIRARWTLFKGPFGFDDVPRYSASSMGWLRKISDIQRSVNQDKTVTLTQLDHLEQRSSWLRDSLSRQVT